MDEAREPVIFTMRGLTSVLYGGLSVQGAVRIGEAYAPNERARRNADDLFALPSFFSLDTF